MANLPPVSINPLGAGSATTVYVSEQESYYDDKTAILYTYSISHSDNAGYRYDHTVVKAVRRKYWASSGELISETPEEYTVTDSYNQFQVGDYYSGAYYDVIEYTEIIAYYECLVQTTVDPAGSGTASGGGYYFAAQTCTLSCQSNSGYTFHSWLSEDGETRTTQSFSFEVSKTITWTARFGFDVSIYCFPEEGGTATGGGVYLSGQQCTIHATPNPGYRVSYIYIDGTEYYTDTVTFEVYSSPLIIVFFEEGAQTYTITTAVSPAGAGTVTGLNNPYYSGDTCSLTAEANPGYTFSHWTDSSGAIVSQLPQYTFSVTQDETLTAHFDEDSDSSSSEEWEDGPLLYDPATGFLRYDPVTENLRYLRRKKT